HHPRPAGDDAIIALPDALPRLVLLVLHSDAGPAVDVDELAAHVDDRRPVFDGVAALAALRKKFHGVLPPPTSEHQMDSVSGNQKMPHRKWTRCPALGAAPCLPKGARASRRRLPAVALLDAFYLEHSRCGELECGMEGNRIWMTCTCRAVMARR